MRSAVTEDKALLGSNLSAGDGPKLAGVVMAPTVRRPFRYHSKSKMFKKTILFGLAFGCAFAITAVLAMAVLKWYSARPKPWNAEAITCVSATVVPTYNYNPETRDLKIAGFAFTFALANNTGRDYTVPQNLNLFKRGAGSKALADFTGKLGHSVLIPAAERAEMNIWTEYSCSNFDAAGHESQRDDKTCFNDAFGDVVGFVALDDENKIRLNLSKPSLSSPKKESAAAAEPSVKNVEKPSGRMLPPNKGDVIDRVAACSEADRLVLLCKKKNFQPPKGSFAAFGGYPDHLPDLPQPPKGYKSEGL